MSNILRSMVSEISLFVSWAMFSNTTWAQKRVAESLRFLISLLKGCVEKKALLAV